MRCSTTSCSTHGWPDRRRRTEMATERRGRGAFVAAVLGMALATAGAFVHAADASRPQPELAELLAPWAGQWSHLDLATRARLEANARRWLALDPPERAALMLRLAELESMPPAQRAAKRATRQAWATLSDADRDAIRGGGTALRRRQRRTTRAVARSIRRAGSGSAAKLGARARARRLAAVGAAAVRVRAGGGARGQPCPAGIARAVRARRPAPAGATTAPAERESFRRRLLDTPPAQRAAVIRQRLEG
ncbi:DUF3106 domain-containing protein [Alkalisalibacterium limincola]|uniref:DUF3106 domain-containing protein n=1 Tax=Alkalisalibacterium limincola TaxID=2699169 RepID=A0A5C8KH16_9GAMM|nr:DUF3106 domain-containing protein [Alkalisalibacterium limincola]